MIHKINYEIQNLFNKTGGSFDTTSTSSRGSWLSPKVDKEMDKQHEDLKKKNRLQENSTSTSTSNNRALSSGRYDVFGADPESRWLAQEMDNQIEPVNKENKKLKVQLLNKLKNAEERYTKEITKLTNKNNELTKNLKDTNLLHEEVVKQRDELYIELKDAKKELDDAKKELDDAKAEKDALDIKLKNIIRVKITEIIKLTDDNEKLNNKLKEIELDNNNLVTEKELNIKKINNLEIELRETKVKLDQLKNECEKEILSLKNEIEGLNEQIGNNINKISNLEKENGTLKEKIKENSENLKQIEGLNKQIENNINKISTLEKENGTLKEKNEKLKAKLLNITKESINELKKTELKYTKEITQLTGTNKKLTKDLELYKILHKEVVKQRDDLNKKLIDAKNELDDLNKKLIDAKVEKKALDNKLQDIIRVKITEIIKLTNDNDTLNNKLKEIELINDNLVTEKKLNIEKIKDLEIELRETKDTLGQLRKNCEKEIDDLKKEIENLKNEKNELKNEKDTLEIELREKIKKLEKEIDNSENDERRLMKLLDVGRNEIEQLENKIEQLNKRISYFEEQLTQKIESINFQKELIDKCEEDKDKCEEENKILKDKIEKLKKKNKILKKEVNRCKKIESNYQDNIADLEVALFKLDKAKKIEMLKKEKSEDFLHNIHNPKKSNKKNNKILSNKKEKEDNKVKITFKKSKNVENEYWLELLLLGNLALKSNDFSNNILTNILNEFNIKQKIHNNTIYFYGEKTKKNDNIITALFENTGFINNSINHFNFIKTSLITT